MSLASIWSGCGTTSGVVILPERELPVILQTGELFTAKEQTLCGSTGWFQRVFNKTAEELLAP